MLVCGLQEERWLNRGETDEVRNLGEVIHTLLESVHDDIIQLRQGF